MLTLSKHANWRVFFVDNGFFILFAGELLLSDAGMMDPCSPTLRGSDFRGHDDIACRRTFGICNLRGPQEQRKGRRTVLRESGLGPRSPPGSQLLWLSSAGWCRSRMEGLGQRNQTPGLRSGLFTDERAGISGGASLGRVSRSFSHKKPRVRRGVATSLVS